jgi:hypothetical protein
MHLAVQKKAPTQSFRSSRAEQSLAQRQPKPLCLSQRDPMILSFGQISLGLLPLVLGARAAYQRISQPAGAPKLVIRTGSRRLAAFCFFGRFACLPLLTWVRGFPIWAPLAL